MKLKFTSSSTWHDRFLLPLAYGLIERGYQDVEVIIGEKNFGDLTNCIVISSYHADFKQLRPARVLIALEHAISFCKSYYAHPDTALVDYMLVQGEVFSQWLTFCHPHVKQLKSGWHRIEELHKLGSTRQKIIQKHSLNPNKPIILYLPTWNTTGMPAYGGSLHEAYDTLMSLKLENLLILPHPSCQYGNGAYKDKPGVVHWGDTYQYLAAADLAIGDNSSALTEFASLDKPVIHIDKWGDLRGLICWNHNTPKTGTSAMRNLFQVLQLGEIVPIDTARIKEAIDDALATPHRYKSVRDYMVNLALYNRGNSLSTTLDCIEQVIKGKV